MLARLLTLALGLAWVAILVGCAPDRASSARSAPVEPTAPSVRAPTPTPTPVPRPESLRIELYEWSIHLEPADLPAGEYRVEVVNMGRRVHDVVIVGPGVDFNSRRLAAGQSQTFRLTLATGAYQLWCSIGDHRDYGMVAFWDPVAP